MLGGSNEQILSIKKAVEMGFHTIICDYLPNNPGKKFAHEHYEVSTMDKEAVTALAKKLKVDGVVCCVSDAAAPTAAYVREQLGMPTNPYKSVKILTNKDMFREFLKDNGFKTPKAKGYSNIQNAINDIGEFTLPVMIKPVDASGSRGITILHDISKLNEQIEYALSYSRGANRFVIEEFVEKDGYQIAGDGFSVEGKLVFTCFGNTHFNVSLKNPFVPIGSSFPCVKSKEVQTKIHNEIQRLLTLLEMKTGAYNFDIMVDKNGDVVLMDIGARNGGNLIPETMRYATGIDTYEYSIKAAMGMDCSDLKQVEPRGFYSRCMIHSKYAGVLKEIWIDDDFRKNNILELNVFRKPGDKLEASTGDEGVAAAMILTFSSEQEMIDKIENIQSYVNVLVE